MALLFPSNPAPGQIFSSGPTNWIWDGTAWTVAANFNYEAITTNIDCGDLLVANDAFGIETEGDIVVIDAMFPGPVAQVDFEASGPVSANPI
jgi:hypothetical protein